MMQEQIISEQRGQVSKTRVDPIVTCNVWCVSNTKQEIELGLPEGDKWMPIAIDFSKIVAIKLAGDNEFIGDDKSVIYVSSGENFTTDIPYQQAINMWRGAHR